MAAGGGPWYDGNNFGRPAMTPNDQPSPEQELSPQELRRYYDIIRERFTADKLAEYINDDEPTTPAAEVMAEFEAMVAEELRRRESAA
jgi:hypothetical protein